MSNPECNWNEIKSKNKVILSRSYHCGGFYDNK